MRQRFTANGLDSAAAARIRSRAMTGVRAFLRPLLAALCLLLPPAPPAAASGEVVATGISVSATAATTSLVVDLSQEIPVETIVLTEPDRIVLDLPRVLFLAPQPRGDLRQGLVRAYRFGLFLANRSRIVMDLAEPARVERIDFVPVEGAVRLVVQMQKTGRESFVRLAESQRLARLSEQAPAGGTGAPVREGERPLVVLDPGHGGVDPGAAATTGDLEKDIVLAFARRLRTRLESEGRVEVAMTREDDSFVPLQERVRMARARNAALFVSIHADSLADQPSMRGASVYTLSERASDAVAARAAEKENRADLTAGIDLPPQAGDGVGDILFDLARRETRQTSVAFARDLVAQLSQATPTLNRPLRSAGFIVLRAPDVPAVLLELGYLSNGEEAKRLSQPEWQDRVAEVVAAAISSRFERPAAETRR